MITFYASVNFTTITYKKKIEKKLHNKRIDKIKKNTYKAQSKCETTFSGIGYYEIGCKNSLTMEKKMFFKKERKICNSIFNIFDTILSSNRNICILCEYAFHNFAKFLVAYRIRKKKLRKCVHGKAFSL